MFVICGTTAETVVRECAVAANALASVNAAVKIDAMRISVVVWMLDLL